MAEFTSYTHGTPNWVDVMTNDPDATKAFYSGLFGWEPDPTPMPDAGGYEMFQLRGKFVAGLGPAQGGAPPAWNVYLASDDVDATAAKIKENGGMLFMEPMDVFEAGRMLFGADPTGAAFGAWQAKLHIGAQLANEPNTFVWNEVVTPDFEGSQAFYTAVFGWKPEAMGDGYAGQDVGNGPIAGLMASPDEASPRWVTYFAVESIGDAVAKVKELGGTVLSGPTDTPFGPMAAVKDTQGAGFSLIQLASPDAS
jgi:uncharacterized protein